MRFRAPRNAESSKIDRNRKGLPEGHFAGFHSPGFYPKLFFFGTFSSSFSYSAYSQEGCRCTLRLCPGVGNLRVLQVIDSARQSVIPTRYIDASSVNTATHQAHSVRRVVPHHSRNPGRSPSKPANDDGSRMTRQPVQDPTFPGFGRRPHAQSPHTHRHSSSAPSAQQPQSMDAHRLSKCFFSTHVPPRTGKKQGLRASPSLPRFELPASLLAFQSVSHTNGSGEESQCLERDFYTVRYPLPTYIPPLRTTTLQS